MGVSTSDTVTLSVAHRPLPSGPPPSTSPCPSLSPAPDAPRPPSSPLLPRVQGSIVTEYGGEVMTKKHFDAYQELKKLNPAAAAEWKRHYRVFSDHGQYLACSCGCALLMRLRAWCFMLFAIHLDCVSGARHLPRR